MSYTCILVLLTSPMASPTANRVMDSFRETIGTTRAISLKAITDVATQALRMTKLVGSIVCNI